jgi:hypothetical protein
MYSQCTPENQAVSWPAMLAIPAVAVCANARDQFASSGRLSPDANVSVPLQLCSELMLVDYTHKGKYALSEWSLASVLACSTNESKFCADICNR